MHPFVGGLTMFVVFFSLGNTDHCHSSADGRIVGLPSRIAVALGRVPVQVLLRNRDPIHSFRLEQGFLVRGMIEINLITRYVTHSAVAVIYYSRIYLSCLIKSYTICNVDFILINIIYHSLIRDLIRLLIL